MEIEEVRVETGRMGEVRAFYGEVLGLPVAEEDGSVGVTVGATRLVFLPAGEGEAPVYHLAFNIPENQMEEGARWLEGKAALLADAEGRDRFGSSAYWNAHMVYFRDPAGSILELIARHGLPTASDAPFGPGALLSVSEVGLPVADVVGTVAALGRLGLPPYGPEDEEGSDTFAPVGDERGLLIVVREGRGWYPIGEPAVAGPVEVRVRGGVGGEVSGPEGGGWRVVARGG